MDIKKLNDVLQDIYIQKNKSYEKLYISYSKIIKTLAISNYKEIKDTILYDREDFIQEIWKHLIIDLSKNQYMFFTEYQFYYYLEKIVIESIIKINS